MECPKCHKESADSAVTCLSCGADLSNIEKLDQTVAFLLPNETIDKEKVVNLDTMVAEGPVLVVVKGRNVGELFSLNKNEITLGRDPLSDIFLNDITVSREHALISIDNEKAVIRDVGSLNGTYVNNKPIEEIGLNSKDEIRVGKFKFVYLDKKTG